MAKLECIACGDPVDPSTVGVYREVTGWEKVRVGGGANQIVLRLETGQLMCGGCGERKKLNVRWGVDEGQGSLI